MYVDRPGAAVVLVPPDPRQQHFARETLEPLIWQRLEQVRQQLSEHRAQHFYSAMLRFHHHRSTRFMGQWIEAKNR